METTTKEAIMAFTIETGVHGATRINTRKVGTEIEARALARRWAESNSTGDYWAEVTGPSGRVYARFNLPRPSRARR
jgi:hypothetical protein